MKIDNIGRAVELIKQREHLLDVIEKLERETISITGDDGKEIDELDECVVNEIRIMYQQHVEYIEKEIEEL